MPPLNSCLVKIPDYPKQKDSTTQNSTVQYSNVEIPNKDIRLIDRLKEIKKIYNDIKQNADILENIKNVKVEKVGNSNLICLLANKFPSKAFKLFIDEQKKIHPNESVIILVSCEDNKVSIIVGVTEDLTSKFDATNFV